MAGKWKSKMVADDYWIVTPTAQLGFFMWIGKMRLSEHGQVTGHANIPLAWEIV